ncbi:MAG: hypothetical protein ACRD2P_16355 [Terriglobia bacterium]
MTIQRRCLAPGCGCAGYVIDMETYEGEEDEDALQAERTDLRPICNRCGHADEEHELAPSDEWPALGNQSV